MSRPRSPHTHDLDAVLRDDLALEQISRGRRPRGADHALRLLCALAEDVDVRVPRRRMRGSRFSRGVIATAVAGTVLGITGVAAAQPGGQDGYALWAPRQEGSHIRVADRSLAEARTSIAEGRMTEAAAALDRADAQLREAGRSRRADELRNVSTRLRSQADLPGRRHALPTTPEASSSWPWAWGISGRQPSPRPDKSCTVVVCLAGGGNTGAGATRKPPYWPQQTPSPGAPSSSGDDTSGPRPPLRLPTVTTWPMTPGLRSPSSPSWSWTRPARKPTAPSGGHSMPRPQPSATASR